MEQKRSLIQIIRNSLIAQIFLLFFLAMLLIGTGTFISQRVRSNENIKAQMENVGSSIAKEVSLSVKEFASYKWLLRYWYDHADELFIEYDVNFGKNTVTESKSRLFCERNPGMILRYIDMEAISRLSKEDQKLYAEIAYSWMITRLNEIKRSYSVDYLFVISTSEPYDMQFFLLSAADPGAERGTEYEQVYPLGVVSSVGEDQRKAMADAVKNESHLAAAGAYVDYYAMLETVGDASIMIGLTYDLSDIKANIQRETWLDTRFAMIFQTVIALIFTLLTYLFIIRPLKRIQQNIRLYKTTKDSKTVRGNLEQVHPHNEIGDLSEDISSLTKEMDDYVDQIETITAERERIVAELSLATRIQESQLPNVFPPYPDRTEFDLYAAMDPAKEVGGDFYDFFMIDQDHLCMVIADVSGKGIPAALFMMASKIIIANNVMMKKSPAEVLRDANDSISRHNPEEMFVTVWLGILEISTGKLTAANAGHEYPIIKNGTEQFEICKDKHGFVIGGMSGMRYKEYEIQLQPGARLLVYTDGVPEATNAKEELFGMDKLLMALNALEETDAKSVLEGVRKAVDDFTAGAEQFDDLTMLCLEYRGGKENG